MTVELPKYTSGQKASLLSGQCGAFFLVACLKTPGRFSTPESARSYIYFDRRRIAENLFAVARVADRFLLKGNEMPFLPKPLPMTPVVERDCPCGNGKLKFVARGKNPRKFRVMHFEPGTNGLESEDGCLICIEFETLDELDNILANWPT